MSDDDPTDVRRVRIDRARIDLGIEPAGAFADRLAGYADLSQFQRDALSVELDRRDLGVGAAVERHLEAVGRDAAVVPATGRERAVSPLAERVRVALGLGFAPEVEVRGGAVARVLSFGRAVADWPGRLVAAGVACAPEAGVFGGAAPRTYEERLSVIADAAVRGADRVGCGHATQGGGMPSHREAVQAVERLARRVAEAGSRPLLQRETLAELLASAVFAACLIDDDRASGYTSRTDAPPTPAFDASTVPITASFARPLVDAGPSLAHLGLDGSSLGAEPDVASGGSPVVDDGAGEDPIRVFLFGTIDSADMPPGTRCVACKSRVELGEDPPSSVELSFDAEGRAVHAATAYHPQPVRTLADYQGHPQGDDPERGVYVEGPDGRWRRCRIEPLAWTVRRLQRERRATILLQRTRSEAR